MSRSKHTSGQKVELEITPMIDVIFLLLSFFVMTFKIVAPEGDFNVKMPQNAPTTATPDDSSVPITVRLQADARGNLSNIVFGNSSVGPSPAQLRAQMVSYLGDAIGPAALDTTEVEIDADNRLKYENVIEALTALTGYIDPETGQVVRLVEKIKFKPPAGL